MKFAPRIFLPIVLCTLAVLPVAAQTATPSVAEQYLFSAANAERAQRGLPALRWDDALYQAAGFHADAMAAHSTISHQFAGEPELATRGATAGAHFSVISENVAMAATAVEIHDMWMNSPHHRDNLLDSKVDKVAIRVVRRNGELYAVEDFAKSVASLSLDDQERKVASLLQRASAVTVLTAADDARKTCALESGYVGPRKPWFVMRFTAGDLNELPGTLQDKLASGKYHQAVVGACPATGTQNFAAYNIAVLLYP